MFSKKKKEESGNASEEVVESLSEKNRKKVQEEISVHTMPEKFLSGGNKADQAKKMGVIILASASIFLVIFVVLMYVLLFSSPKEEYNNQPNQNQETINYNTNNNQATENSVKKEEPKNNNNENENNVVSTSSEEVIEKEIATTTQEKEVVEPVVEEMQTDSDNDGLSDVEEDMLDTNKELLDSDGDGYNDLDELLSLYNPSGEGKLVDNLGIDEYINTNYNYSVLHPTDWKMNIMGSDDSIVFTSKDKHILQIYVQPNTNFRNIEIWYEEETGNKPISSNLKKADNWRGIFSEDGLTLYLIDNAYNYIYTLVYIPESDEKQVYKNIFDVMVKSFEIKEF